MTNELVTLDYSLLIIGHRLYLGDTMLERREYLILLFDFYGALLTEKQRLIFDLYYQDDLSLGEIAEKQDISRQAVYDIIKRSELILEEYENKLQLVNKFQSNNEKLQNALVLINELDEDYSTQKILELKKNINDVINEN